MFQFRARELTITNVILDSLTLDENKLINWNNMEELKVLLVI